MATRVIMVVESNFQSTSYVDQTLENAVEIIF